MPRTRNVLWIIAVLLAFTVSASAQVDPLGSEANLELSVNLPSIETAAIDPSETQLIVVGSGAYIFNVETGEEVAFLPDMRAGLFRRVVWSTDSEYVAIYEEPTVFGVDPRNDPSSALSNIFSVETTEQVDEVPDVSWNWSLATQALTPATSSSPGNESAQIQPGITLTIGDPARVTGNRSLSLGDATGGAQWFEESSRILVWSKFSSSIWDFDTGSRLVEAFHHAPDTATAGGLPQPPQISGDYLITFNNPGPELRPEGSAIVFVQDDGLSLRGEPNVGGNLIERLPTGTEVNVTGFPVTGGQFTWWPIEAPSGNTGWAVEGADGITTLRATGMMGENIHSIVRVYAIPETPPIICELVSSGNINVRSEPSTESNVSRTLNTGEVIEASAQITDSSGFTWWQIQNGWVREDTVTESGLCEALPSQ